MAEEITQTISLSRTTLTNVTNEDKEIASKYNQLVSLSLDRAQYFLRFGTPDQKMKIVVASMHSASRLAALDTHSEVIEQRIAFERLVDDITDIPEITHLVTSERILDVAVKTFPKSTDNQDNLQRFQEVEP